MSIELIPNDYLIKDFRDYKSFNKLTISNYKKNEVLKSFKDAIINYKLEDASYFMVELHCSGYLKNILNEINNIYINHIHLKNPSLLFYLNNKINYIFKKIIKYNKEQILLTRNSQEIRNILIDIVSLCTLSKKTNLFSNKFFPKIKEDHYISEFIKKNKISKNLDLIIPYINNECSSEIILALNEIINLLNIKNSYNKIIFWIFWLIKIVKDKKKKNIDIECFDLINNYTSNLNSNIRKKWEIHLWNIILDKKIILSEYEYKYIFTLYTKYIDKLTNKNINSKIHYLLIVLYILTMNINWNIKMINNEIQILESCCNINTIYGNIELFLKKNIYYNDNYNDKLKKYLIYENEIMNLNNNNKKSTNNKKKSSINKNQKNNKNYSDEINNIKLNLYSNLICYKK